VKKLSYKINYLSQFFSLDPETGFFVDKFTNTQLTTGSSSSTKQFNETLSAIVSEHQEHLVDLNAIFLRHLAPRNQKKSLDSRFQIFQEISEADIEIADCQEIVDFTRCSYSVTNQDKVHILLKGGKDGEQQLRQYQIVESSPIADCSVEEGFIGIKIV
jgi:hypothetical protein